MDYNYSSIHRHWSSGDSRFQSTPFNKTKANRTETVY